MTSVPTTRRRGLVARLGASIVGLGLVLGLVAAGTWVVAGRPAPATAATAAVEIVRLGGARYTAAPDQPYFVLLVGTGARSDDPSQASDDPGLADAIHVLGVNPAAGSATILNIPRDTEGPGGGKMNSYIRAGGEENLRALADAVTSVTGAPITYIVRVNFPNFAAMIDDIGGIDMDLPTEIRDPYSGADYSAGMQHITGDMALAIARTRYSMPRGDIDRTTNQALIMIAALRTLQARNPSAGDTVRLVATAGRHVVLDNLGIAELFRLGQFALAMNADNVKTITLPVGSGSGSNLRPSGEAGAVLADFTDDAVLQSH